MAQTRALQLDEVSVRFGALTAVDHVSLDIGLGERWALIGPNGAGKTTLFRVIAGELRPSSGSIGLFENDVTTTSEARRARLGLGRTFQISDLFPGLTAEQNVTIAAQATRPRRYAFWRSATRVGDLAEVVDDACVQAGIADLRQHLVKELSHGAQRQLELAMALAQRPKILLLDEPAAGLSAAERLVMHRLISSLPTQLSVILVEHDTALALDLVHRVLCLDNGSEVARGTPDDIRGNPLVNAVYLKGR